MATQVIGGRKRSRFGAILVTLILALVVIALARQASSIWSSSRGPQVQPAVQISFSPPHFAKVNPHIPAGCRPKYGCQGARISPRP